MGDRIDRWIEAPKDGNKAHARKKFVQFLMDAVIMGGFFAVLIGFALLIVLFPWVFISLGLLAAVVWGIYKLIWLLRP